MKNLSRGLACATLLVTMSLLAPGTLQADDPMPQGKMASVWVAWPQPGHEPQFEEAVKAYVAWRKAEGDPFAWRTFTPVVGTDLAHYVFRSGNHEWKDLDAENDWEMKSGAVAKWQETVGPHLARIEHHLGETDFAHSNWTDSPDYRYFGVEILQVAPGAYGKMVDALSVVHKAAVDAKWPQPWSIEWSMGGEGGMVLVTPFKSYADMADQDPSFTKVLATTLGSEGAAKSILAQLNGSFVKSTYTIYAARPDLSTPQ